MSHLNYVYGYIEGEPEDAAYNRQVIAQLPVQAEYSPLTRIQSLTRDMFAIPTAAYECQMCAFGQVYNNMIVHWEAWLTQFEQLLRQLHWNEAHLHLMTELCGTHQYHWITDFSTWHPNEPGCTWTFSGGPRIFTNEHYR